MARKPNFNFERAEREKAKAAKTAERAKLKAARKAGTTEEGGSGNVDESAAEPTAEESR